MKRIALGLLAVIALSLPVMAETFSFGTAWSHLSNSEKGDRLLTFDLDKPVDPLKLQVAFEYFSDSIGNVDQMHRESEEALDKRVTALEQKVSRAITVMKLMQENNAKK